MSGPTPSRPKKAAPLLYNKICSEDNDYNKIFNILLMGTLRSDSQVSSLHREEPVLRLIRSYLKPDNNTTYRVRMQFCIGCCQQNETPFLEALVGCGGVPDNFDPKRWKKKTGVGKGSLLSQTIVSTFGSLKDLLLDICEEKNEDGTYLSEIQIRARFQALAEKECTGSHEDLGYVSGGEDDFGCGGACALKKGACGVLPGDTVYWEDNGTMTHFKPATHEELKERGWIDETDGMGKYERWTNGFRMEKAREREEAAESTTLDAEQGDSKRLKKG